ncbi:FAD-dependent monooxygenase [Mycolicibacterium sp. CBM1]
MSDLLADVLIVGAGPNGLMLAAELALAGVHPVVVDRLAGPSDEQKANALVGQVVRALDIRGLYELVTGGEGPPAPVPGHVFAGMPVQLAGVPDNPMFHLPIPQPRLVRLLAQRVAALGATVHWEHDVVELAIDFDAGIEVVVSSPNGIRRWKARYLVAADGGRSMVRRRMGIGFPGVTTPMMARMAHIAVPDQQRRAGGWDVPGGPRVDPGLNRFGNGAIFYLDRPPGPPMVGAIEFDAELVEDETPLTVEEVRDSVRRILATDVEVSAPSGPGPYALRRMAGQNTRQADRYRVGNVLMLGDAAHVHPPIGGPGLNLGLQDAMNLGWKLAAEVKGWAPEGLLDSYHDERHPVGERVMMHTLAQLTLLAPGGEHTALRSLVGELLAIPAVAEHIAHLLAGSDVRYDVADEHRLSGRFVPELQLADGRRIAELLHTARPVLVDLCGGQAAEAANGWHDRIDVVTSSVPGSSLSALLIRPDGYVAWCSDTYDMDDERRLRAAIERWFGPRSSAGTTEDVGRAGSAEFIGSSHLDESYPEPSSGR